MNAIYHSKIRYKGLIALSRRKDIDHGKEFDWGRASKDYAKYRDIYPPDFYRRIIDLGLCVHGQTALDLGTGTGVLPRNLYRYGADWTGIDLSENQIAEAVRLAAESGMKIRFITAPAENTGLLDGAFDAITACQCFMYFAPARVLPEILRLLKPGGRLLLLFMAWLPFENEISMKSENLVLEVNPSWTGGRYRRSKAQIPDWSKNHFECFHCFTYDVGVTFTRESWHGRIIACRGVSASSLPQAAIESFKKEHWELMQTVPECFTLPHQVTLIDLKRI